MPAESQGATGPVGLPANARLLARAERDLLDLLRRNPREALRVIEDIIRLARRDLPLGQVKKLPGMGVNRELSSGRFRVVHFWNNGRLFIVTVFPKKDQRKVFRHLP